MKRSPDTTISQPPKITMRLYEQQTSELLALCRQMDKLTDSVNTVLLEKLRSAPFTQVKVTVIRSLLLMMAHNLSEEIEEKHAEVYLKMPHMELLTMISNVFNKLLTRQTCDECDSINVSSHRPNEMLHSRASTVLNHSPASLLVHTWYFTGITQSTKVTYLETKHSADMNQQHFKEVYVLQVFSRRKTELKTGTKLLRTHNVRYWIKINAGETILPARTRASQFSDEAKRAEIDPVKSENIRQIENAHQSESPLQKLERYSRNFPVRKDNAIIGVLTNTYMQNSPMVSDENCENPSQIDQNNVRIRHNSEVLSEINKCPYQNLNLGTQRETENMNDVNAKLHMMEDTIKKLVIYRPTPCRLVFTSPDCNIGHGSHYLQSENLPKICYVLPQKRKRESGDSDPLASFPLLKKQLMSQ